MNNVRTLPLRLETRARLLAMDLRHRPWAHRNREIKREAGRLGEQLLASGVERWQAVKSEDDFTALVRARLRELDESRMLQQRTA